MNFIYFLDIFNTKYYFTIIFLLELTFKEKINILGKKETFNHSNFYFIKAFLIYLQKIIEKIHFLFSFYITYFF